MVRVSLLLYHAPTANNSFVEVINHLKVYLEQHPDIRDDSSRWIEGMGWDQTKWPGAQFPTAVMTVQFSTLAVN